MKKMSILLIAICIIFIAGCTSINTNIPQVAFNAINSTTVDYEVIKDVKVVTCKKSFALYPIPIFWGTGNAMKEANYKAIEAVPDADAIISPRIKREVFRVGIWYKKDCVTLKGKAVMVKNRRL